MTSLGEHLGGFEGPGLVVLVGVTHTDDAPTAARLAEKVYRMRVFEHRHADSPPGEGSPRELSAEDLGLPVLVISQFTLYAETRKGRRPTWDQAAPGPVAAPLVDAFAAALRRLGARVETGRFGADMEVSLVNDGPYTVLVDSGS